jgi:hypothetical protein
VPIVASDIPALAELIDDGDNGLLFESENAEALANAIRRALTLPPPERQALLTAAKQRFERDYTIDRMVARHEEVYRRLAAVGGRAGDSRLQPVGEDRQQLDPAADGGLEVVFEHVGDRQPVF